MGREERNEGLAGRSEGGAGGSNHRNETRAPTQSFQVSGASQSLCQGDPGLVKPWGIVSRLTCTRA